MSSFVLDSSALLALIFGEPGGNRVQQALTEGAVLSAVNYGEVTSRLADGGMSPMDIQETLLSLNFEVVDFDERQALQAGLLRPLTQRRRTIAR